VKHQLTIVIPCKNEQAYISHLLDHLKKQKGITGVPIIIADKSDDNTRAVIAQHQHGLNVKVIEGGPVSRAKNNGAELVETPYILFIDSDVRFFSDTVISDTLDMMERHQLDLIGLNAKCYDNDIRAHMGFGLFNIINKIMSNFIPFAVGAYFLTRTSKFREVGGFPEKYPTSEDFHLSRKYDLGKFKIAPHYFGQDSRRFKKMGYFGMTWYLIKNFINRNNKQHWQNIHEKDYW
jgi:glycosyltransferase involved in cell wall biosynthesis